MSFIVKEEMEKSHVKEDIAQLLAENIGAKISRAFYDGYADQTIPIYVDGALKVLSQISGKKKASEQLNIILIKHNIQQIHE